MRDMLIKLYQRIKVFFRRYGLLYGVNAGIIVITIIALRIFRSFMPPYEVHYEPEMILGNMENSGMMDTVFHYYLDFSPSMEGFFSDEIDSSMRNVAEALKEINTVGNEKKYFLCANEIESIPDNLLYESMESKSELRGYYDEIINSWGTDIIEDVEESELENEKLGEVINDINLARIFYQQYGGQQGFETGTDSLNVIITDLNFKKNSGDEEGQEELIHEFAEYLSDACAASNVALYQIYSNFAGITSDEYEWKTEYGTRTESQPFFIIVESQNAVAYEDFTGKLEKELTRAGIDCSKKYELVNRISDEQAVLNIDLTSLRSNGWIDTVNLNYDNKSFENLENNEIGLRMVRGKGKASLKMHICPIEIIGSNNTEQAKAGDVSIEVEAKASYPAGKGEFKEIETEILSAARCGTVWEQEELYLRMEIELMPDTVLELLEENKKNRLFEKSYFVIEMQFFLEKPDYSLPEWLIKSEDMDDKREVYDSMIESKEAAFVDLSEEQRYMGSTVLYITY